jgi:hypothetical protein
VNANNNQKRKITMRRSVFLALIASVALVACSKGPEEAAAPVAEAQQPWAEFAANVIDEYYRQNPETAVDAGLHEYDGQMSDVSIEAANAYAAWIDTVLAEAASYSDLEGIEAFERDYLATALGGELFWIRDSGFMTNNPLVYTRAIGVSVYVDREYAPLEQRLMAYTQYMEQVPDMLQQMKENLRPPLPAPYVEMGFRIFSGMVEYLSTTVPEIFAPVEDEQLQRQFEAANGAAIEAIQAAASWLEEQKATASNDFALGEERFLKMLSATQGVDITLEDLKAAGQRNLDANLEMLYAACAEFAPGESTEACIAKVSGHKPEGGAVAGARRQLPMLKEFVVDTSRRSPAPKTHSWTKHHLIDVSISRTSTFLARSRQGCRRPISSRRRIRSGRRKTSLPTCPEKRICWPSQCMRSGLATSCSSCIRTARKTMLVSISARIHSARAGPTTPSR